MKTPSSALKLSNLLQQQAEALRNYRDSIQFAGSTVHWSDMVNLSSGAQFSMRQAGPGSPWLPVSGPTKPVDKWSADNISVYFTGAAIAPELLRFTIHGDWPGGSPTTDLVTDLARTDDFHPVDCSLGGC